MLAGLPKGPTYYSPDRHPERAQERLAYVVARMQEDGDAGAALDPPRSRCRRWSPMSTPPQRDSGYYFLDHVTPRSAHACRHRPADHRLDHGSHHDPARPPARRRGGPAGGSCPIRDAQRPGRMARSGSQSRRRGAPHRGRCGAGAAAAIMTTPAIRPSEGQAPPGPGPEDGGSVKPRPRRVRGQPKVQARLAAGARGRSPAALRCALDDRHRARRPADRGLRVGLADGPRAAALGAGIAGAEASTL